MPDLPQWQGSSSVDPHAITHRAAGSDPLSQITKAQLAALGIVDADVAAGAAIAKSKLAPLAIVNADIDAAAAIAKSKLAPLAIVNADVDAAAAIAKSKLAPLAIVNADVDAAAAIAKSKLAPLAIVNADVAAAAAIAQSKLALAITDAEVVAANKDGAAATPSLRTLGAGAQQALPGTHEADTTNVHGIADTATLIRDLAETNLKVLRGIVNANGTIAEGVGFTVTKNGTGDYTINFTAAFSDVPAFVAGSGKYSQAMAVPVAGNLTAPTAAAVRLNALSQAGAQVDSDFHFIAMGPA